MARIVKYFTNASRSSHLLTVIEEMGMTTLISLSNLGNCSTGPEPQWAKGPQQIRLLQQFFTQSGLTRLGCDTLVQYLLTYDKQFMWVVVHDPDRHSRRFEKTCLDNLEQVLLDYCTYRN